LKPPPRIKGLLLVVPHFRNTSLRESRARNGSFIIVTVSREKMAPNNPANTKP